MSEITQRSLINRKTAKLGLLELFKRAEQLLLSKEPEESKGNLSEIKNSTNSQMDNTKPKHKNESIKLLLDKLELLDCPKGSITVHTSALFRRVIKSKPPQLSKGDLEKLLVICFYTSFKLLNDVDLLTVDQLSRLTGFQGKMLVLLEEALVIGVLEFDLYVSQREFLREQKRLKRLGMEVLNRQKLVKRLKENEEFGNWE